MPHHDAPARRLVHEPSPPTRRHPAALRRLRGVLTLASSLALAAGGLATAAFAGEAAATAAVTSVRVAARPAIPAGARPLGATAAGTTVRGDVALKPRNASELAAFVAAVSRAGSPLYGRYLDLSEFKSEFAPTGATVRAVESSLRAGGLRVSSVSGNRLLVGFSGTAAAAEATFHTSLRNYRLANGRSVYANTGAVFMRTSVPSAIAAVVGLNTIARMQPILPKRATKKLRTPVHSPRPHVPPGAARACAAAAGSSAEFAGLTADQLAYAYGLDPLYQKGDFGQGQTVDILDLYGYIPSDIRAFDDCYYGATKGAEVFANDRQTSVDNGVQNGNPNTGTVETEIDTDAVNAYAPGAKVDVYEGPPSNPAFLDIEAAMADDTSSKIASISYGGCELAWIEEDPGFVQAENYLFEEDAVMGKTVFVSTGDEGSEACGLGSVYGEDPSTQPYVTAVGGTATTAATNPPAEDVWNSGYSGGAGTGDISTIWRETGWQQSSRVPGMNNAAIITRAENVDGSALCADAGPAGGRAHYTSPAAFCREVPDVSAQADPNTGGLDIVVGGQWQQWGGTSLASPTWAAIAADIASTPSCATKGGVGFLAPKLYAIASSPTEYAASFTDVTIGYNDNDGFADGLFPATKGYDMASGLGTPLVTGPKGVNGLAYYACATPGPAPSVTGITPKAISSSAISLGTTLTIHGSAFSPARAHGGATVAAVTIGDVAIPSSHLVVGSGSITVSLPKNLLAAEEGSGYLADGTGTYAVTVTLSNGTTSAASPSSRVIFYDPGSGSHARPQVDGTSPPAGVAKGGTHVTIYGSGFSEGAITSVTFGGVAAKSYHVVNDGTITAVTPNEPKKSGCVKGDNPSVGVCQVAVKVTGAGGSSPEPAIPLEGSGKPNPWSGFVQAPNEYDFEPAPFISSLAIQLMPAASEGGGSVAQLTGKGLGPLGLLWANVGPWQSGASDDYSVLFSSSTVLDIALPAWAPSKAPLRVPVTVQTFGSQNMVAGETLLSKPPSNTVYAPYAPSAFPSKVIISHEKLEAGPTSGGQTVTIVGRGLDDTEGVIFTDPKYGFLAVQAYVNNVNNNKITFTTPAAISGVYRIEVCNLSDCAKAPGTYTYYLPGNPSLTSDSPKSGAAGTTVTLHGYNLGYTKTVWFGTKKGTDIKQPAFWESGNTNTLTVRAPKEKAGTVVDIRVETIESIATGYGRSRVNKAVTFRFK